MSKWKGWITPTAQTQPMDTTDLLKECQNMKKERSLSAPEALYYPSIADQVLALKQANDPRIVNNPSGVYYLWNRG